MSIDERNRPWLYPQRQEHPDDKRRAIPRFSLWPTIIIGAALGLALAMLTHGRPVDPAAEAVRHAITGLWS